MSAAPAERNVASAFVQLNGSEPEQLKDTESALLEAISKRPDGVWYLRYQLGFSLYRDRMQDVPAAKRIIREMITESPTNDGHSSNAVSWLLSAAENENEFRQDVDRILKSRREYIHWKNYRGYPANWAKNARRNKELRERADYVMARIEEADRDPVVSLFLQIRRGPYDGKDARIREELLKPANFQ